MRTNKAPQSKGLTLKRVRVKKPFLLELEACGKNVHNIFSGGKFKKSYGTSVVGGTRTVMALHQYAVEIHLQNKMGDFIYNLISIKENLPLCWLASFLYNLIVRADGGGLHTYTKNSRSKAQL